MRSATLTILGLHQYDKDFLIGQLNVPSAIDKELLITNLVAELAELELLYPDLDTMAFLINAWSTKQLPVWNKLQETLLYEYDPIYNYDRTETITETTKDTINEQTSENKKNNGDTSSSGSHSIAAYNSNELLENERNSGNASFASEIDGSGERNVDGNKEFSRSVRMFGNIGVTTTQQMIEEERRTVKFSLYDYIIQEFKERFCVLVY